MAWFANYTTCNMMTGNGFDTSFFGSFGMAWLGIVILFFLIALARRWIGEEMDMPFSFIGGLVGSILPYFLIVFFSCSYKWGLLGGIIGGVIGAFFLGNIIGESAPF